MRPNTYPTSTAVLEALNLYDRNKGIFRKLWGDHHSIRSLRTLYKLNPDMNYFLVIQCFLEHPVKIRHSSEDALHHILKRLLGDDFWYASNAMELFLSLHQAQLFTEENFNFSINKLQQADMDKPLYLSYCCAFLSEAGLLSQANFNSLLAINDYQPYSYCLGKLDYAGLLTQANVAYLIRQIPERIRSLAECFRSIYIEGLGYNLTQTIFNCLRGINNLSYLNLLPEFFIILDRHQLNTERNIETILHSISITEQNWLHLINNPHVLYREWIGLLQPEQQNQVHLAQQQTTHESSRELSPSTTYNRRPRPLNEVIHSNLEAPEQAAGAGMNEETQIVAPAAPGR